MDISHEDSRHHLMDINELDAMIDLNDQNERFEDPGFKLLPKKPEPEKRKSQKDGGLMENDSEDFSQIVNGLEQKYKK
jgi:hypothetical protein